MKDSGHDYEKMHACPIDCMLFWKENNYSVCGSSRWKNIKDSLTNESTKIPTKVLRYLPFKTKSSKNIHVS